MSWALMTKFAYEKRRGPTCFGINKVWPNFLSGFDNKIPKLKKFNEIPKTKNLKNINFFLLAATAPPQVLAAAPPLAVADAAAKSKTKKFKLMICLSVERRKTKTKIKKGNLVTSTYPSHRAKNSTEMKLGRLAFRSINTNTLQKSYCFNISRSIFTNPISGNTNALNQSNNESVDEFENRIFEGGDGNSSDSSFFFRQLDKVENKHRGRNDSSFFNETDGNVHTTLYDGMQGVLRDVAMGFEFDVNEFKDKKKPPFFEIDPNEVNKEDYAFRPDFSFRQAMTYEPKDLDLTKPGVRKTRRRELEVTTKQVLEEADFRNVKFLAQFMTEGGIIIKRSMSGISAKAQRKIAREIKTARAFGLMPFTTMGSKSFAFGRTMEDGDEDYSYRTSNIREPDDFDRK